MGKQQTNPIRAFRTNSDMSLDQLADAIAKISGDRPSKAKLSRIETNKQPVPLDMLFAISKITGISRKKLRPDVAKLMEEVAA
jgi:transcriptional regulator with XRE-family HTH domain